jgi:hypothetical protein
MQQATKPFLAAGKLDLPLVHLRSGWRWLLRLVRRYAPFLLLLLGAVPVVVLFALDLTFSSIGDSLNKQSKDHEVAANLLEHTLVAVAVAAVTVYWVLGRKRQTALKRYRSKARKKPAEFVEWSRGEQPVIRLRTCQRLADAIARSGEEPAVAVIQGRPGTGRTSCIVGLVRELAKQKMIPIPVLAKRDGTFDPEELAREKFCRHVDKVLSSDQQADAIWHRARSTRDIVILVDGLDDEIIDKLSTDGGNRFRQTIRELRDNEIAVVLATTRELPLDDITPVREDLHLFTLEEATSYLHNTLQNAEAEAVALAALKTFQEPIDGFLVAPFFVDLIVRLQKAGISLNGLPRQTDRWRADVLKKYLHAIEMGRIQISGADAGELRRRARAAKRAAELVADRLKIDDADRLSVARVELDVDEFALRDAQDLNLLWRGDESVGFSSEDLGAYLVAARRKDPRQLLRDIRIVAESEYPRKRRDRYVRSAFIFWHLRHRDARAVTFKKFLDEFENREWTRPSVAVAAVRIAYACRLTGYTESVTKAVDACLCSLDTKAKREAKPWQAYELLELVRALAAWPRPEAHRLLWDLATKQNLEIEWWAAKALAMSKERTARILASEIEHALAAGEQDPKPEQINQAKNDTGQKIASLAWILPALSDAKQFSRLRTLCLAEWMSPLRGEMQLAQGLKLALLNGMMVDRNVEVVRELLARDRLARDNGGRSFWHARLVLVQALLAYAWDHPGEAKRIRSELLAIRSNERHPLVRKGIDLARRGLLDLGQASGDVPSRLSKYMYVWSHARGRDLDGVPSALSKYMYMWGHERDAVRWVELGKPDLAQLAADAVLLSNMTYRLREDSVDRADETAAAEDLPPCIRKSSCRQRIDSGCEGECSIGLCQARSEQAVLTSRAPFSASFCRDQARLIGENGAPRWTTRISYRRKKSLKEFWDGQANLVQSQSR